MANNSEGGIEGGGPPLWITILTLLTVLPVVGLVGWVIFTILTTPPGG